MQLLTHNYRSIAFRNSELLILVDERDYERLSQVRWNLLKRGSKVYAARMKFGQTILMHREVMGYHSESFYGYITHDNGNTLDNRFANLRTKYSSAPRNRLYVSNKVRKEINSSIARGRSTSMVHAIDTNGIVLKSNIASLIADSNKELASLLCQRLRVAQLVIESKDQLVSCSLQLAHLLSEVNNAIASLNEISKALLPK